MQNKAICDRPNIVLIVLDDMGQRDLGCYGSEFYETPNIDNLAKEGMLFTDAYAACPVCSPSRASILTGKYPARLGLTDYIGSKAKGKLIDAPFVQNLPLEEKTIAKVLQENGYATWHVGKWHLGGEEYYPEKHGFDVNVAGCFMGAPRYGYISPYKIPNLTDGPEGEYLTDRLTDECIQLIRQRDRKKPFFLNLWHYAVHIPIQVCDELLINKYKEKIQKMGLDKLQTFAEGDFFPCEHKKKEKIVRRLVQSDPYYAAMIENVDKNIGRLFDVLKQEEIYDSTAIIFTSDNGGLATAEGSPTCNSPLAEGKGWLYDGGVRVPLLVKTAHYNQTSGMCNVSVTSPDLYPTILDIAGIPLQVEQHVDGKSFCPVLKGEEVEPRAIFWHYPHYGNQGGTPCCAVRKGKYKLVYFFEDKACELYNLEDDISEENNLSEILPEVREWLRKELFGWIQDVEALIPKENPEFTC